MSPQQDRLMDHDVSGTLTLRFTFWTSRAARCRFTFQPDPALFNSAATMTHHDTTVRATQQFYVSAPPQSHVI